MPGMMSLGRIAALLRGPRFWMLFSMLCARGVGFVMSFALARLAGAQGLGTYTTVLNTASAVSSPVAQVLANNATMSTARAHADSATAFRSHARGHLLLGVSVSLPACLLLLWLLQPAASEVSPTLWLLMLVAGSSVACGQIMAGIIQGVYQGAGHFLTTARVTALVAAGMGMLAIPAVWWGGIHGAFLVASLVALLPALLLALGLFWPGGLAADGGPTQSGSTRTSLRDAFRLLWRGLPSVGATAVNSAVNWLCTIYLVRGEHGMAGIGLVAVATQWSTLLLLPATSWGGLTLKALTDSVASRNAQQVRAVLRHQVKRNLATTGAMAIGLCLLSGVIAHAYGLANTDLWLLFCINAAAATVAAANNVFERLLVCLDAQPRWFMQSVAAFGVQVIFTAALIHQGVVVVAIGVLLAGLQQALLTTVSLRGLLTRLR